MIYVGLDIAAEKHSCCILSEDKRIVKQFSFANNIEGFTKLLGFLSDPSETKIGLESTGVYGNNLVEFLRRNGYMTHIFNPLLVKKGIQATTLRKTKTDKSDAKYIAQYTMEHSQPNPETSYHILELKSLSRARISLVHERSKVKTLAKGVLVQIFPEFYLAFSDVFGTSACTILKKYPSAKAIAGCQVKKMEKLLCETSRGRLGREKAEFLINLAKRSVGTRSCSLELQLQTFLEQIDLFTAQILRYESQIKQIMNEIDSPITTIPGIGYVLGAAILGEIGDISRFSSPAKLQAYAGVDPSISDSGSSVSDPGHMVKHGSHFLRWALGQAARCVSLSDPVFAAYMQTKRAQGKHYSVACSHVAKKLTRVIFAILKKNTAYSPDYPLLGA